MASSGPELQKFGEIINQSVEIEKGTPTRYRLKPKTDSHDESETYRKMTVGEKDKKKPHKSILMVGETGTGKTKLINAMINYMLGVQRKDKVWFEITDDQSDRTSAHSQTSSITVYGFYLQESPIHLTIIDTPGYGDTDAKNEKPSINSFCCSTDMIDKIDAVCLVIKSTQTRVSERQQYIFDAVQTLFGNDFAENIVLLFTHSRGAIPKNVLTAVEEAKIKCAVNEENQPVYFLFDNCQSAHQGNEIIQEQSWNLSHKGMKGFFKFLDNIKPKSLKMTRDVLQQQKKLEENISKLQSQIHEKDMKQNHLKEAETDLQQIQKYSEENNFEDEVEVLCKEKIYIDPSVASVVKCCSVCEENFHYPGCWWLRDLLCCRAMKNNHCTVCTNKCHYKQNVKGVKINETKTERRPSKNSKEYDDKSRDSDAFGKKLEVELQELEKEKIKLVIEAFHCVETLQMIALNTDSLLVLLHVDFLIEKMKEINEPEKVKTLEDIKKRAGEKKNRLVEFMKRRVESENLKAAP